MLLEHALLPSGDIAEGGAVYAGWPAQQLDQRKASEITILNQDNSNAEKQAPARSNASTAAGSISESIV